MDVIQKTSVNHMLQGESGSGGYLLLIELPEQRDIRVGKLGCITFYPGFYTYAGSALSGFKNRLNRHLTQGKKLHWHIDYLVEEAYIREIVVVRSNSKIECLLAQFMSSSMVGIPGFGCSDCRCYSHLYFTTEEQVLRYCVQKVSQWAGTSFSIWRVRRDKEEGKPTVHCKCPIHQTQYDDSVN